MNVSQQLAQELISRKSIMLDRSIIRLETVEGFQIVDPHRFRVIAEQRAEADFVSPYDMGLS
jgi:hypothetical protein